MALIDIEIQGMAQSMMNLNRAVRGMPDKKGSLRAQHKLLARLVADLHTELRWARARVTE
ncbi:hypothetical protein [Kutzneria kofuensis]|uniref:Uncharacterized protein n=1 Tax=Kutzneria kofuensis TaxID=103725 RepID=A0A7W9KE96_9PSEU|nr:hypothetical protein [Kutzneria kofuensis]MBB5891014.1 hypothetical protein [Kutzneria kofuensis]